MCTFIITIVPPSLRVGWTLFSHDPLVFLQEHAVAFSKFHKAKVIASHRVIMP